MPDLRELRSNIAAFADAIGCPLAEFQARSLGLRKRTTAIVAPRQSGKSRSLAVLALHRAFRESEHRILVVSAGEDASRRLLADVRRIAQGSELLRGSVVDEMAALLSLTNGSEIRSLPASERQVRGWTCSTLLVDEAAMPSDDLILGAALPTTSARADARIVFASSAQSTSGTFYDHVQLGEAGSEHVEAFRWSLLDCPWIAPSVIAAARESMSELRFQAEFEGVFAGSSDSLFPRHVLDRGTVGFRADELDGMFGPARTMAGCDWGATRDRSALVAIGRIALPDGRVLFAVRCAKRWPEGHLLHRVVEDVVRSPGEFHKLSSEVNGLGAPCTEMLFRGLRSRPFDRGGGVAQAVRFAVVEETPRMPWDTQPRLRSARRERGAGYVVEKRPVHTTAALKAAAYASLRLRIDRGELIISEDSHDLLRELLMLRVSLSPGSDTDRIEASSGHDDLCDALMLATQPFKRAGGVWQTWLDALCHPANKLPEPIVPEAVFAQECAPGPDGAQVPVRPAWVSPQTPELTLPGGLDLTDPTLRRTREQVAAALERSRT